ncbi:hypothetical protein [Ligilactobacillus agilis]|uniref:hypothetical protein n=1 Tax=Ligilactobacillus agilis TaxID=1601 RepID=UPI00067F2CFA|nr:hypothetical protein [Ligilactobacillus agilis]
MHLNYNAGVPAFFYFLGKKHEIAGNIRYFMLSSFSYVVICDKINKRYPTTGEWLDYGAIVCAIVCILFHPFSISFLGFVEIITVFTAIYGMLITYKKTGNSWGAIFAFCFIWNAL